MNKKSLIFKFCRHNFSNKLSKNIENLRNTIKEEIHFEKKTELPYKNIQSYFRKNDWIINTEKNKNYVELKKQQNDYKINVLFSGMTQRPELDQIEDILEEYRKESEIKQKEEETKNLNISEKKEIKKNLNEIIVGVYIKKKDLTFFLQTFYNGENFFIKNISVLKEEELKNQKRSFLKNEGNLKDQVIIDNYEEEIQDEMMNFVSSLGFDKIFLDNIIRLSLWKEQDLYVNFLNHFDQFLKVD